jgi:iron transport multicopper oxidase
VLVTARNDTSSNWAIHANLDTDMFDGVPAALQPSEFDDPATKTYRDVLILDITASITYNSSGSVTSPSLVDAYHDMNDTSLVPVVVEPMLPVDRTIELEVSFDTMTDGTNRAMFNQVSYLPPLVPTVLSVLTLGSNATDATPYGYSGLVLDHLSAVQIIIKNGDIGNHPLYVPTLVLSLYHCVKAFWFVAIFTVTRCR